MLNGKIETNKRPNQNTCPLYNINPFPQFNKDIYYSTIQNQKKKI